MATVYLGLGSNEGDLETNIARAYEEIEARIGKIISQSSLYYTEPWGFESPNKFINAVCAVETFLSPHELLSFSQLIEREMGRKAKSHDGVYEDRIIDIDILLYDNEVINMSDIVIPHPLMTKRAFVMQPLAEIAPSLRHPVLGDTIRHLYEALDESED